MFIYKDRLFGMMQVFSEIETFYKYQRYINESDDLSKSLIGLIIFMIQLMPYFVLSYILWLRSREISTKYKIFFYMFFFSLLFIPIQEIGISMISRMALYFSIYGVVVIPNIFNMINSKLYKQLFVYSYCLALLADLYAWTKIPWVSESFTTFHTIFQVIF